MGQELGVGVVRGPETGGGCGVGDELDQVRGGDSVRWGEYRIRSGGIDGVEPDEGVEVHDAATLVLSDLPVGDPQLDPVGPFEWAEGSSEGDHGAAPEFAVWVPETPHTSRDLLVLVEQPTEPVVP
jgi:hypothetical protein